MKEWTYLLKGALPEAITRILPPKDSLTLLKIKES
jgi:hypothetical protein